jgi:L-2-hydroxyglutarate oxidase
VPGKQYDVVVIGAGIIGLSTAKTLLEQHPGLNIAVLEKDAHEATQQSGHNSGVIHSGIYYKPGSLKAQFCVEGRASMTRFCEENEIPVWTCGKLIVAHRQEELPRLDALLERGTNNKVEGLQIVEPEQIKDIEPHVNSIRALWAPKTGIVDYRKVAAAYARIFREKGGEIHFNSALVSVSRRAGVTVLSTESGEFEAKNVINCAGLHSDRIAEMMGAEPGVRIIPFRGEYYTLKKDREHLVKGLIYPVPDPAFPFLGVHLTQTMKGWVEAGPNAVLATKREGYRKRDFSIGDMFRTVTYPGFWKMSARQWKTGMWEMNRSFRKGVFLKSLQMLVPQLTADDLSTGGSGVRAQAVDRTGKLLDDFSIKQVEGAVHVLNAPSPGATSSLVIGNHIAKLAAEGFSLN